MTGILVYDSVDPNDRVVVEAVLRAALLELARHENWHDLEVDSTYYFKTRLTQPPSGPGWYVIVDGSWTPLYVGVSADLNLRLNSQNGSRDSFADPTRRDDSVRNFLKRF